MIQIFRKRVIERTPGVPYLIRWNLFGLGRNSWLFSIKVHKILLSDDECLHDHPWAFLSIILKGGYEEYRFMGNNDMGEFVKVPDHLRLDHNSAWTYGRRYKPGSVLFRKANYAHRIEVDPTRPCWTLVFTFRKVRKWGFFTKTGWKYWREYSQKDC